MKSLNPLLLLLQEDNSSLTEDDASECDSDSSITNKRMNILRLNWLCNTEL